MESNEELIAYLKAAGYIKSKRVEEAFRKVDRKLFVPKAYEGYAYRDIALPLSKGATISAPGVVAYMIEMLDVHEGMKVLEVGSGSGYTACLLSALNTNVYSIEISEEVLSIAKRNIEKCPFKERIRLKLGDGKRGWKSEAPFDRILVNAAGSVEKSWLEQLKDEGYIVMPLLTAYGQQLVKINKRGEIVEKGLPVVFVELR